MNGATVGSQAGLVVPKSGLNRIVKVTTRVGESLAGRCRAAHIDGVLEGGPASFEAWIV